MAGFELYSYAAPAEPVYQVIGNDSQILNVRLQPGHSISAEPGAMMHCDPNIGASVPCECGDGCKRCCSGENFFKVVYTNNGTQEAVIGITPNFPAKIVPVDLSTMGGEITCKAGAYMCHIGDDVQVSLDCDCCSATCCCGGMGAVRQHITGSGTVFLAAGGTILQKTLQAGEIIVIDTNSIVGWQAGVELGIRSAGGCCMCCCGGEGMFNSTLTGPGTIFLQSMSFEKFKRAVAPPQQGGGGGGGGGGGN